MFNVKNHDLIDSSKCYDSIRAIRWPDGPQCPHCLARDVIKRGFDNTESERQRYSCNQCRKRFDDLTNTVFSGHQASKNLDRLPLFDGLKPVQSSDCSRAFSYNKDDVHLLAEKSNATKFMWLLATKAIQYAVKKRAIWPKKSP